jgi:serine/threonine protein kinase
VCDEVGGGLGLNSTKEDSEDVEREVAIMYHLGGHDNIVNLKQAYEDKNNVQLVRACGSLIAETRTSAPPEARRGA